MLISPFYGTNFQKYIFLNFSRKLRRRFFKYTKMKLLEEFKKIRPLLYRNTEINILNANSNSSAGLQGEQLGKAVDTF